MGPFSYCGLQSSIYRDIYSEMDRQFACDPGKRERLIAERGIDLLRLSAVFLDSRRLDFPDRRYDYGEERRISIGTMRERVFTVVYTIRGPVTWLITGWSSSRKERQLYERER
jgi:uncharacterized protein